MSCGLLDLPCHAKGIAIDWWLGLPWYLQVGLIVAVGFMIWGMVERLIVGIRWVVKWLHRIGGWQAIVGGVIAAAVAVISIVSVFRKPDDFRSEVEGNDAKSSRDFVIPFKPRRTAKRTPSKEVDSNDSLSSGE